MESVVSDSIRAFERFLSELGELKASGGLGIEREEGGVEVFDEFLKGFLGDRNSGVGQFIIPHLREGYSSSFAHLVECKCDLSFIRVIDGRIDEEVCTDGFHPAHGISRLSREIGREGCFEFGGNSGHGGG